MRWGLIARPELDRGIGIQTHEMYRNLHPDYVLMVHMERTTGPTWTPDCHYDVITPLGDHKLPMKEVKRILLAASTDVLVTVETFYDPELIDFCREHRIKTINQMNPEFYRGRWPAPTEWWWPTAWRLEYLPQGVLMPVPVPWVKGWTSWASDGPLNVLHVVGKPAIGDRNGTRILAEAMRQVKEPVALTVTSQAPSKYLAMFDRRATVIDKSIDERRDLYDGADVLVLPRRFGGLSLPVLEAFGSGIPVIMPAAEPNLGWPIVPVEWKPGAEVTVPCGHVATVETDATDLARVIDALAKGRVGLGRWQHTVRKWALNNTWEALGPRYMERIEAVAAMKR